MPHCQRFLTGTHLLCSWLEHYGGFVSSLYPILHDTDWLLTVFMDRQMILDPGELLDKVYYTRTCLISNVYTSH